jgi:hypothetical protein
VEDKTEREDERVREGEGAPEEEDWLEWSLMEERNG